MKRLLTLLTMMVMGAVGVRPQPPLTDGRNVGVTWMDLSHTEKIMYVDGALSGYLAGSHDVIVSITGGCPFSIKLPDLGPSPKDSADADVLDIVKEMDEYYSHRANLSVPMFDAFKATVKR